MWHSITRRAQTLSCIPSSQLLSRCGGALQLHMETRSFLNLATGESMRRRSIGDLPRWSKLSTKLNSSALPPDSKTPLETQPETQERSVAEGDAAESPAEGKLYDLQKKKTEGKRYDLAAQAEMSEDIGVDSTSADDGGGD